jgi:hypothetical protein
MVTLRSYVERTSTFIEREQRSRSLFFSLAQESTRSSMSGRGVRDEYYAREQKGGTEEIPPHTEVYLAAMIGSAVF